MAVIVKLIHGANELDINTGRYCIDDATFSPPTAARSVTYSRIGVGSEATRKRRANRSWQFNLTVVGASKTEAERALRELQAFLNRAEDKSEPLYVAYRAYNDYTFEPYFGLSGAFMRYEVEHGAAEAGGQYPNTVGNSNSIPNVNINLVIRPQAVGLGQRAGQATGGVFENYIGKNDNKVSGTIIPEATSNIFPNPAFMNATYDTGWSTSGSGMIKSENKKDDYILFGDTSVKVSTQAQAASHYIYQDLNVGDTQNYILSAYVKAQDDSTVISTDNVRLWYNVAITPDLYIDVGDGWYRVIADITGIASSTRTGVYIRENDQAYYIDGVQLEQKASLEVTAFCYGDLLGCSWAGTKNNSISSRTAALVRYKFEDVMPGRTGYTIRVAWTPEVAESASTRYFLEDSDDDIGIWITTSETITFQVNTANSVTSSTRTYTPGAPLVYHFTFDGDTATIYESGASVGNQGSLAANTAEPTSLYIGSDDATANHLNGTIHGFATFDRAMTAAEVLADYNQTAQQVADNERVDPLPYLFTEGGDDVIDNETDDSTLFSYGVVAGLMGDDVDAEYYAAASLNYSFTDGVVLGTTPVIPRYFDRDIVTIGGTNTLLFVDGNSSADTDGNNDTVKLVSVGTSSTDVLLSALSEAGANALQDTEEIYAAVVLNDTGSSLQLRLTVRNGGASERLSTPWRSVSSDSTFRAYVLGPLSVEFSKEPMDSFRALGVAIEAKRATGASTNNILASHMIVLPNYSGMDGTVTTLGTSAVFASGRVGSVIAAGISTTQIRGTRFFNAPIVIKANRLNVLMVQTTYDNYSGTVTDWVAAHTTDFDKFEFTPRFDIL